MEDIGTPEQCQMHCNQEQDCKGFAHLFSNQTCWLKSDILQTVYLSSSSYIGPKQCRDENSTALAQGMKYQTKILNMRELNKTTTSTPISYLILYLNRHQGETIQR